MHQQQQRPVSTYDNLSAASNNNGKAKQQQQQQQLLAGESSGLKPVAIRGNNESSTALQCDAVVMNGTTIIPQITNDAAAASPTTTTMQDLNETSHSIAAVRAALSDAKSKFFGININETTALASTPSSKPTPIRAVTPQSIRNIELAANDKTPMAQSQRFGATYEQIPLADLDAPSPSQAVYMSTTVPQNMKGMKIAGRHTPTRNSLRHSRMIVVNHKNHDSIQESYSTHIRHLNLSRQLLILQMAIGLLIVGLAIWILILAPSASILINPYLSGLSLLLASIAGLILLGRDRRADYQRTTQNNCYKVLLAESYVFSALALIFCCLALVCAAIEFAELQATNSSTDGSCGPATSSLLSYRNCSCLMEEEQLTSSTDPLEQDHTEAVGRSNNIETSCEAIRSEWKYLLGFSMALNTVGIIATFLYITIFICCLNSSRKHFTTSV